MHFTQIESKRETQFKDAVLNSAEAKSIQIITQAQQKSDQAITQAKLLCQEADHDILSASFKRGAARQQAEAAQQARRELLLHRSALVADMLTKVAERLADFTAGKSYGPWLQKRLALHAGQAGKGCTVFLRPQDVDTYAELAKKALPGCQVQPDATIRLGGARINDGRVLYDETLDTRLADEEQAFYQSGALSIR